MPNIHVFVDMMAKISFGWLARQGSPVNVMFPPPRLHIRACVFDPETIAKMLVTDLE